MKRKDLTKAIASIEKTIKRLDKLQETCRRIEFEGVIGRLEGVKRNLELRIHLGDKQPKGKNQYSVFPSTRIA